MRNLRNAAELDAVLKAMERIAGEARFNDTRDARDQRIADALENFSVHTVKSVRWGRLPPSTEFIRAVYGADPGRAVEVVTEIADPYIGYSEEKWVHAFSKALQSEAA
jgi:hypothetical protein